MKYSKMSRAYSHEIEDSILTASEREAAKMSFNFDRKWLIIFWVISLVVMTLLIFRSFFISVVQGDYYSFVASGNSVRSVPIIAPRGKIYDVNDMLLADNMPSRSVIVLPHLLPDSYHEREIIAQKLSEILDKDVLQVKTVIDTAYDSKESVPIVEHISHEQALAFRTHENELVGIQIQQTAIRNYTNGEELAHIIGYEGLIKKEEYENNEGYLLTDRIGKTGIEYEYEKYLHGVHGAEKALVDSRGNVVKDLMDTDPVRGRDVHLNIDAQLQKFLYERLQKELERAQTERAAAVIIDPRSGAVRALVSLPSYDNNIFAQGIDSETYGTWITDPNQPLFDRAIGGTYAPGSTVKPIMGIAALAENIISPDQKIESRGGIQVGSFFFGDWRVHGFTDLRRAIAVSSDVYFYTVGGGYGNIVGLGIDRMAQYMQKFGFGKITGIDLPGEVGGMYPNKQWKEEIIGERWYVGNTYHAAIGQGYVAATPLQVANAIVPIANGGTLYEPHIVAYIDQRGDESHVEIPPKILQKNIAPQNDIKIIQEGMRQTVTEGTATMLSTLNVPIAGKTGTAQFGNGEEVHSWFVSYAPYDDPTMVMVIMVEGQTGELSSTTVPVAFDVYKWNFGGRDDRVFEETTNHEQSNAINEIRSE